MTSLYSPQESRDLPTNRGGRLTWMDALRGLAILLVISQHLEGPGLTPEAVIAVNDATEPFRMALLMFLSGMLLPRTREKTDDEYFSGKVRNLLWPWFVWTLTVLAMPWFTWSTLVDLGNQVSVMHTWFLLVLFLCFVTARVLKAVPTFVIAIVFVVLGSLGVGNWITVPGLGELPLRFVTFGGYFFFGAAFSSTAVFVEKSRVLTAVVCIASAVWVFMVLAEKITVPSAITVLGNLLPILAVVNLAYLIRGSILLRPLEFFGRDSIIPYVAHFAILNVLHSVAMRLGIEGEWAAFFFVYLGTVGACACAILLRPWTTWLYSFPRLCADPATSLKTG